MSLDKNAADNLVKDMTTDEKKPLSKGQVAKIDKNRQKALLLRHSRMVKQRENEDCGKLVIGSKRVVDSGGGFFIEEDEGPSSKKKKVIKVVEEPAPNIFNNRKVEPKQCEECDHLFDQSYLFTTFDYKCCDACRDSEERHALISKTNAKNDYLLSDVDLFKREPPLKFVMRENPLNQHWSSMKLFLKMQIEERALEVWGSPEGLEEEKCLREEKRENAKRKKYQKKMTQLRKEARSSLYTIKDRTHNHEYGEEVQIDDDKWKKTCKTCDHTLTYEKL